MRFSDAVEQFLLDLEALGRSESLLGQCRLVLGQLERWLYGQGIEELEEVDLLHLRKFVQFLRGASAEERGVEKRGTGRLVVSSVALYVRLVKRFFRWCYQEELLEEDPAGRLRQPRVEKKVKPTLRPEQVEALLGVCDVSTRDGLRDYAIVAVLLDTGIRVSELVGLRLVDLDLKHRCLKVRKAKGKKERVVGLYPLVAKVLWRYLHMSRPKYGVARVDEHVFLGARGPLKAQGVRAILWQLVRRAGLEESVKRGECPRVTPHVFRHTFSKRYLLRGGDLFKLSRMLGHSSVQVTSEVYLSDFQSEDALGDHDEYSPSGEIRFPWGGRRKKPRS
ncbi:tyrosine-type recombinase/integrase [Thermogemmatispora aurantia]|uniref:tyrosine-type recombinase/integrase n=1 Tax=Thermogemmatispora aurantia TaxID=2045279 RepID=UPI00124C7AD7|nr:tyrosine-type recombinase/integrase [Thermogemmatispora aurantia]